MKIHTIQTKSALDNFTYVIEFNSKAICIDPYYPEQIMDVLEKEGLKLIAIINTHEHNDHTCGNKELKLKTNCEIWAHEKANIDDVSKRLKANDKIELDSNNYLEIMDTPGHTFTHVCIKVVENGVDTGVFTGDTLFCAGVGNCYSGDEETLYETISRQFFPLEESVNIYPGHDYLLNNLKFTLSIERDNEFAIKMLNEAQNAMEKDKNIITDIEIERKINLFFRLNKKRVREELGMINSSEKEVFLRLRSLRNRW